MKPTYKVIVSVSRSDSDLIVSYLIADETHESLLAKDFPVTGMEKLIPLLDEGILQEQNIDFSKSVATMITAKDVN